MPLLLSKGSHGLIVSDSSDCCDSDSSGNTCVGVECYSC